MENFFVHESSYIDANCNIGQGTKIWHFSHILSGTVIGMNCNIGQNVVIGPDVHVGNGVKIQNNVSLYKGVHCEDEVFIGPSVVFTNILIPRSAIVRRNNYVDTKIKKGASIGANATIVCGIEIGSYALIGAGAVVTKNVKAHSLVIGNPARHHAWVSHYGHSLIFDEKGMAICPESNRKYQLEENSIVEII